MLEETNEEISSPTVETPQLSSKEVLNKLVALQVKDKEIDKLRRELNSLPRQMEEKNNVIADWKRELEESKQASTRFAIERKNLEMELAKKEEEIRKHSSELQLVKTNEAYRALLHEIDSLKQEQDICETKILEVLESLDQTKRKEVEAAKSLDTKKKVMESEIADLTTRQKSLEEKLKTLLEERSSAVKEIPESAIKRYERLLSRKSGLALVAITQQGSCGGCQMSLTQGIMNDLLKNRDFVYCESCQRILYIP